MITCSFHKGECNPDKIVVSADLSDPKAPKICEDCVEAARRAISEKKKPLGEIYTNVYKEITG